MELESGICYSVRKDLFMLFVCVMLISALMLFMNCCICCTLSSASKKNKEVNFKPSLGGENSKLNAKN